MSDFIKILDGKTVNVATAQFIVNELADLPVDNYNFGSIAMVIHGTDGIEFYIADADKVWTLIE